MSGPLATSIARLVSALDCEDPRGWQRRGLRVKAANHYYSMKGYEYFQIGRAVTAYRGLPNRAILDAFSRTLERKLKDLPDA